MTYHVTGHMPIILQNTISQPFVTMSRPMSKTVMFV